MMRHGLANVKLVVYLGSKHSHRLPVKQVGREPTYVHTIK